MLKNRFPGVLDLNQWGRLLWSTQKTLFSYITTRVQIWLFLCLNCRLKWTKGQLCPPPTHHALAVLVVFSTVMSQPLFNCCGGIGPVWHYVGCWHHLLFSWTVSTDVVLSQPKWFASEWMFQAVQIAVIFFFFFLFFFFFSYRVT